MISMVANSIVVGAQEITYSVYRNSEVSAYEEPLARLDEVLFYEFPYLYQEPSRELQIYRFHVDGALFVVARCGERIIGIAGGMSAEAKKKYIDLLSQHAEYQAGKSLYVAEVVVDKEFQQQGVGREIMRLYEQAARDMGYTDLYLITVVRSDDHPLKPEVFIDLHAAWQKLGFTPTHITAPWQWSTRCGVPGDEVPITIDNMIRLWHKKIG